MKNIRSNPIPSELQSEIDALAALPDEQIHADDIPEVRDWSGAKRGVFYRLVRQQTTPRLDSSFKSCARIVKTPSPNAMPTSKLKYDKEEFIQRGEAIYESQVRDQVEKGNRGKIVAIDIETGAFEVAKDSLSAVERLQERYPEAQAWFVRIGHRAVHKVGFAGSTEIK